MGKDTEQYAWPLLCEAARLLSIHCPRCAAARIRRIAKNDAACTGIDYQQALKNRQREFNNLINEYKTSDVR